MDKLIFINEDNTEEEFYIEAKVKLNGRDYLLVSDEEGEEPEAMILKDTSESGSEEARYVIVEDEDEMRALMPLFADELDDTELVF